MTEELVTQKECQRDLIDLVDGLKRVITDQANEVKNREPVITERSLILFSAVFRLMKFTVYGTGWIYRRHRQNDHSTSVDGGINGQCCYSQHAGDDEVKEYLHCDPIINHTAMKDLERASGEKLQIPKEL